MERIRLSRTGRVVPLLLDEPEARRPSLFWPGATAIQPARLDFVLAGVLWALAFALRASLASTVDILGEGAHFLVARALWTVQSGVTTVDGQPWSFAWLWWQRPLFYTMLWPGAALSFTAMRVWHGALTSLVPLLLFVLLRRFGVARPIAFLAAGVTVAHPLFVVWGNRLLFDSLMLVWLLAGLLAAHAGRPVASAVLLLGAAWTKELGALVAGTCLLLAWWREPSGARPRGWPFALGRSGTAYLAVVAVALWPLVLSFRLPMVSFPGWLDGGDLPTMLDHMFLVPWLAIPAACAWLDPRARRFSIVAAAWIGFLFAYHVATGKLIDEYYYVVPATFTLALAALATQWAWVHARKDVRTTARVAASVLVAVLVVSIVTPGAHPLAKATAAPWSNQARHSLPEAWHGERDRVDHLAPVLDGIDEQERLLAIDVDWSDVLLQVEGRYDEAVFDLTWLADQQHRDRERFLDAIERWATVVVVGNAGITPFNAAITAAYADCAATMPGGFTVIRPEQCPDGAAVALQSWLDANPPS
jgi:hypothetical protein